MTIAQYSASNARSRVKAAHTGRKLDRVDIRLLRELLQGKARIPLDPNFRKSFRAIARTMNVDEDTIRSRAKRLEQFGFIKQWRIHPNPHILGLHETMVWLDIHPAISKDDLIDKLKLLPDILIIAKYHTPLLGIVFIYETESSLANTIRLIQKLSNPSNIKRGDVPWPECKMDLSKTDWRIMASLYNDPRKSYLNMSRELGISTGTVQRRLDELTKAGVLFALSSIDPKTLDGTILADLTIGYVPSDKPEVIQKIMTRLDEYLWHFFQTSPRESGDQTYCIFNLALPNVSKAHDILEGVKDDPGVKTARIDFEEDHMILFENTDKLLERKLAQLGLN